MKTPLFWSCLYFGEITKHNSIYWVDLIWAYKTRAMCCECQRIETGQVFWSPENYKGVPGIKHWTIISVEFSVCFGLIEAIPLFFPFGTKKYLAYFLFYRMLQLRDWIFRETLKILEGFELCNFEYFIEIELLKRLKI